MLYSVILFLPNSIEYVVQLVGDDPSNVLCTAIRGKETISNQNVLLIKAC